MLSACYSVSSNLPTVCKREREREQHLHTAQNVTLSDLIWCREKVLDKQGKERGVGGGRVGDALTNLSGHQKRRVILLVHCVLAPLGSDGG